MVQERMVICLLISACLPVIWGQSARAEPNETDVKSYEAAYNYVLEENWEKALTAFETFIQQHQGGPYLDGAHFWRCFAMEKTGAADEDVFRCYQDLIKRYPKSRWADDAKRNLVVVGKRLLDTGKTEYGAILQSMQGSEDQEVALAAVRALRGLDNDRALDALLSLYERTNHAAIRREIIVALSETGSPQALKKLAEIARGNSEPALRKDAVFWLGQKAQSDETIKLLGTIARNDPQRDVREGAVFALAEAREGRGMKALQEVARDARDVATRKRAIFWLGQKAQSDETIEFLQTLIVADVNAVIAKDAVFALAEAPKGRGLKALLVVAKESKNARTREEAIFWLGQKNPSKEALQQLETMACHDPAERIRKRAVFALAEAPKGSGLQALQRVIRTAQDPATRQEAILRLCDKTRSDETIRLLETVALEDAAPEVRERALLGLSEAPQGRGLEALQRLAEKSRDSATRRKAIFWLGQKARSEDHISSLGTIVLQDPDPEVRREALNILAQVPDHKGIPALIRIAKTHPDKAMQKQAIFWLGQSDDPRARQAILDIVNDVK